MQEYCIKPECQLNFTVGELVYEYDVGVTTLRSDCGYVAIAIEFLPLVFFGFLWILHTRHINFIREFRIRVLIGYYTDGLQQEETSAKFIVYFVNEHQYIKKGKIYVETFIVYVFVSKPYSLWFFGVKQYFLFLWKIVKDQLSIDKALFNALEKSRERTFVIVVSLQSKWDIISWINKSTASKQCAPFLIGKLSLVPKLLNNLHWPI